MRPDRRGFSAGGDALAELLLGEEPEYLTENRCCSGMASADIIGEGRLLQRGPYVLYLCSSPIGYPSILLMTSWNQLLVMGQKIRSVCLFQSRAEYVVALGHETGRVQLFDVRRVLSFLTLQDPVADTLRQVRAGEDGKA